MTVHNNPLISKARNPGIIFPESGLGSHSLPLESLVAMELAPASSATEMTTTMTAVAAKRAAAPDLLLIVASVSRNGRSAEGGERAESGGGGRRAPLLYPPISLSLSRPLGGSKRAEGLGPIRCVTPTWHLCKSGLRCPSFVAHVVYKKVKLARIF